MTAQGRALETLKSNLAEIKATLEMRRLQSDCIVGLSGVVHEVLNQYDYLKDPFKLAMESRGVSLDSFHRGLFVTTISSFEGFIKSFVSALVQIKRGQVEKFSELPEKFRNQYLSKASHVLSYIGSGTVQGIQYNFQSLGKGMGSCLSDSDALSLNGEVFTILMGNPTWERLNKLLNSLGIDEPFDQAFGSNEHLKRRFGGAGWSKTLSLSEEKFDELIDNRNLIVHAASPVTIVEADIIDSCNFFEAFADSLVAVIPGRI